METDRINVSTRLKWDFDNLGSNKYNAICALEIMLINLGVVDYDYQWDMSRAEEYAIKFKEDLYEEFDQEKNRYGDTSGGNTLNINEFRGQGVKFGTRSGSGERPDGCDGE